MKILKDCEDALGIALPEAKRGNDEMAFVLDDVLRHLDKQDTSVAHELSAMALFGLAQLDAARGRHGQAHQRREQAVALLDRVETPGDFVCVVDMLADELMELGEHRKALIYCNRAVALSSGAAGLLGGRLFRAGRCHRRIGFNDAALALFRDAIPLLRRDLSFPFLAPALLELGTLAYKTSPKEGGDALREAAAIYEAKRDLTNAGITWLNLGVALAQAGELEEALTAYEKAREIRARNPATTPAQRGNLHNNIAGVYRRKRDFARARAEADQAVKILKTVGGEFLAHALGTLGEIARDDGKPDEALAKFVEARTLYERLPGASLDKLAVKLENEAEALEALGRAAEAAKMRGRIAELRGVTAPPTPVIPLDKITPDEDVDFDAEVAIVLDGLNLPDEVYAHYDLGTLERLLEESLAETGLGEVDGHLTKEETTEVYLVGADARALFEAVEAVLRAYPLCEGAVIELRQGAEITHLSLGRKSVN